MLNSFDPARNLLFEALEHAYECIVVTDKSGMILYMNKTYKEFLGISDVVGQHVTNIIENTRMHLVAETGEAEIASIHRIKGHDMIANRIPIVKDGDILAVFGTVMFKDVRQLNALAATVERLRQEVDYYKEELRKQYTNQLGATYGFDQIIGSSSAMTATKKFAKKVAKTDTTILLTGESGTGKELFAHAIHADSPRAFGPFVRINCAAIPESLLESELFGYEEGAFTGAKQKGKKGKFELANHGTILLDEIGDMPLNLQAKLLRVLQEKEIERVGGTRPTSVDVRVISSTHRDLLSLTEKGLFREDLYYRLNVFAIEIPPLRDRREDLPDLVYRMLDQLWKETGVRVETIDPAVWNLLESYTWPGNVRELRNVLERALYLMEGTQLQQSDISLSKREPSLRTDTYLLRDRVREAEKRAVAQAMAAARGNKIQAATLLGISKSSLYQKLDMYQIQE